MELIVFTIGNFKRLMRFITKATEMIPEILLLCSLKV